MFHFVFNTSNRNACPGCLDKVAIVWNLAEIYPESGPTVYLTGPDKGSVCATINGATPGTCAATPTRNTSWGMIKSLYR
jgi:hypothetical protein